MKFWSLDCLRSSLTDLLDHGYRVPGITQEVGCGCFHRGECGRPMAGSLSYFNRTERIGKNRFREGSTWNWGMFRSTFPLRSVPLLFNLFFVF